MTFTTVYIGSSGWFPVKHCLLSKYANYSQAKPAVKKGEWMVNDEICSDIDYSEYCWLSKIVGESYDAGKMED